MGKVKHKYPLVSILFLAPYRVAPLKAIKYLVQLEAKGKITISAVCTDREGARRFKKFVNNDCVFIDNNKRNESSLLECIKKKNINTLISIQHPWIISEKIINSVDGSAFNNHMARLPDYRGHHTSVHAILNGEKFFSTTLHTMERKVDTGFKIASQGFAITEFDTSQSVQEKMAKSCLSNIKILMGTLINNLKLEKAKIEGKNFFYGKNSIFALRQILDTDSEIQIDRKIRAFYHPPHEPAFKIIKSEKVHFIPAWLKSNPDNRF